MIMTASGGIGNQLFCLASALHISEARKQKIKIYSDNQEFVKKFQLIKKAMDSDFPVRLCFSKKNNFWINKLCGWVSARKIKSKRIAFQVGKRIVVQQTPWEFPFEILKESIELPWFLLGYFQNSSIIESLSADNRAILYSVINSTDSLEDKAKIGERYQIGIHIRRGDYLSIPEYGVLSIEYFLGILSKLMRHEAKIVVASDEEQCLEPFGVYPNTTLLFPTTTKPLNTMEFLSQSDLFIMSNSTFSFWIAWAVTIHGGVVYAPQPWFNNVKTPENYLYLQGFNRQLSIFESLHGKR